MTTWRVRYADVEDPEEIEAGQFVRQENWFVFTDDDGIVAQIRTDDVRRINRVDHD